jgi:hypothetical protein
MQLPHTRRAKGMKGSIPNERTSIDGTVGQDRRSGR